MTDAVVVETNGQTAGIAVRCSGGFEFFAASDPYRPLDRCRFRTLREIQRRLRELVGGAATPPTSR